MSYRHIPIHTGQDVPQQININLIDIERAFARGDIRVNVVGEEPAQIPGYIYYFSGVPGYDDGLYMWDGTQWVRIGGNTGGSMTWKNLWVPGSYRTGDTVRDGEWTMVANKDTTDRPAPQPTGVQAWTIPDSPVWATNSHLGVVYSGQRYQFTGGGGWMQGVRVWAPTLTADTHYRVVMTDNTDPNFPQVTIIDNPVLTQGNWHIVGVGEKLIPTGSDIIIYLDALNSGSDTTVTGGWAYSGTSNAGAPGAQSWNRRTQQDTVRIDKTDLDSTDRTTELLSMVVGTNIQMVQTNNNLAYYTYQVTTAPVEVGGDTGYIEYGVVLTDAGADIEVLSPTTMTATVPVAQNTDYVQLNSHWNPQPFPNVTVTGFLQYDGVTQPGNEDNAFGIDILLTEASVSSDWDLLAKSTL